MWYRLRLAEILISAWLTMFFARVYVHLAGKGRGFDEIGAIFLASVAESTNTPLSLLALALTVSCFCKQILTIAECIVGGQRGHRHVLANGGYTGALTLALLCAQTGVLGMRTEQKAFLLGLVLFIGKYFVLYIHFSTNMRNDLHRSSICIVFSHACHFGYKRTYRI